MRIQNPLHFTEQHHFCVCRDFSLSPVDYRMLSSVYQPMVGSRATGLYMLLFQQIPSDRIGYSAPEQQRKLFLGMDLEPSEKGRKMLAEQASRLEATGLLESKRHYLPEYDDYLYIYRLYPPLSPSEFFQTQHLALLLRDKVGSHTAAALRESFRQPMPEEADEERASYTEDLSVPFYELFQLNAQAAPPDEPEERVQKEIRPDHGVPKGVSAGRYRFEYADIISRFPRHSANRGYVENLKYEPGQLEAIHYISVKYDLTLPELCRLLDEDGVFNGKGELSLDTLQKKASATFRQDKKREEERARFLNRVSRDTRESSEESQVPVEKPFHLDVPDMLKNEFDPESYNRFLRNEPYTLVLSRFFPGVVPDHVLNIFENLDVNYKLKEEVINVLIHYLKTEQLSWNKRYIDSIASDMLGKQVDSYESAVEYVRRMKQAKSSKGKRGYAALPTRKQRGERQKPQISAISFTGKDDPLTEEERREIQNIIRELEELDGS